MKLISFYICILLFLGMHLSKGVFLKKYDHYLSSDPFELMNDRLAKVQQASSSSELPPPSESTSASSLTGPTTYDKDNEANHQYYQSEEYKNHKLEKAGKVSNAPSDVLKNSLDKSAPEISIPDELAELMLPIFPVKNSPDKLKDPDTEEFTKKANCNPKWDYEKNGEDWNCKCSVGERQSPIKLMKNETKKLTDNVRFEFSSLNILNLERPKQIMKNTGRTVKIDYRLGDLFLFPKLTHYEGKQIHFHVQSEHNLDGNFYDMEMHLIYTLAELDRTGLTVESKPILIVSVLFDAACSNDLSSKFLDSLDLDHIPQNVMEEIDFPKHLDFNLLFDNDANAYRYRCDPESRKKKRVAALDQNISESDEKANVKDASFKEVLTLETRERSVINKTNNTITFNDVDIQRIQDFLDYNALYPVGSFYMYNGSLTTPSCDEIVTYIVKAEPVTASLDQIRKIAAAIENAGAVGGNYRMLQLPFDREVFYYEKLDHREFIQFMKETKQFTYPFKKETSYFYVNSNNHSGVNGSFIVDEEEIPKQVKKVLKPVDLYQI